MELSVSQLADHTLFIFLHWTDRGAELEKSPDREEFRKKKKHKKARRLS